MLKRLLRLSYALLFGGLFSSVVAASNDAVVEDIKSVYLYNFLSFITWPEHKTVERYHLCLATHPEFTQRLTQVVAGERVNGKSVSVSDYMPDSPTQQCDLLYVQSAFAHRLLTQQVLPGVLVVTDHEEGLAFKQVMVAFETRGRKVRVALHLPRLLDAGFSVSSKLLRVVRIERD